MTKTATKSNYPVIEGKNLVDFAKGFGNTFSEIQTGIKGMEETWNHWYGRNWCAYTGEFTIGKGLVVELGGSAVIFDSELRAYDFWTAELIEG